MMTIEVSCFVEAIHCWPNAHEERSYLREPHSHKFRITGVCPVSHSDRDIEFHDLRDEIRKAVVKGTSYRRIRDKDDREIIIYDFGTASCEDIAKKVLKAIPYLHEVHVFEDPDNGAILTGGYEAVLSSTVEDVVPRPPIVTICGSTRFKDEQLQAMKLLEEQGYAAFSVGSFMHADSVPISESQKREFDALHKRKIDMSDFIFVVNPGGYVGSSTQNEIDYAAKHGKGVKYMFPAEEG